MCMANTTAFIRKRVRFLTFLRFPFDVDLIVDYVLHRSERRPIFLPHTTDTEEQWLKASHCTMRWVRRSDELEVENDDYIS